jgi:hypothetical protein
MCFLFVRLLIHYSEQINDPRSKTDKHIFMTKEHKLRYFANFQSLKSWPAFKRQAQITPVCNSGSANKGIKPRIPSGPIANGWGLI